MGKARLGSFAKAGLAGAIACASGAAVAATPTSRCYVALFPGSGPDLTNETRPGAPLMERYWNPAKDPTFTLEAQSRRNDTLAGRCTLLRLGFDGGQPWWHERTAGVAARALHDFIEQEQIPDGALFLVGHSMGGLVARYIVNNGAPDAPYFNEHVAVDPRMDYALVRRKAAAIITVATPHTGAEAADALEGTADHRFTNAAAWVMRKLGFVRDSAANASLSRAVLEEAGAPGGDLGDDGRTVPVFTVAGVSVDAFQRTHDAPDPEASGAGQATRADRRLALGWAFLCTRASALNLWGLACSHAPWRFSAQAGDGMVARASAHGAWTRETAAARAGSTMIAGVWHPWLDRPVNHSQSRYTAQSWSLVEGVWAALRIRSGEKREVTP